MDGQWYKRERRKNQDLDPNIPVHSQTKPCTIDVLPLYLFLFRSMQKKKQTNKKTDPLSSTGNVCNITLDNINSQEALKQQHHRHTKI